MFGTGLLIVIIKPPVVVKEKNLAVIVVFVQKIKIAPRTMSRISKDHCKYIFLILYGRRIIIE